MSTAGCSTHTRTECIIIMSLLLITVFHLSMSFTETKKKITITILLFLPDYTLFSFFDFTTLMTILIGQSGAASQFTQINTQSFNIFIQQRRIYTMHGTCTSVCICRTASFRYRCIVCVCVRWIKYTNRTINIKECPNWKKLMTTISSSSSPSHSVSLLLTFRLLYFHCCYWLLQHMYRAIEANGNNFPDLSPNSFILFTEHTFQRKESIVDTKRCFFSFSVTWEMIQFFLLVVVVHILLWVVMQWTPFIDLWHSAFDINNNEIIKMSLDSDIYIAFTLIQMTIERINK